MFRPFFFYIGFRYTRAKKRNHFISFISLTSVLGIALGITVLITVLSVMNGFDEEIQERVFSMAPQITVRNVVEPIQQWSKLAQNLLTNNQIQAAAPFVSGQGMVQSDNSIQPALILGVDSDSEKKISAIGSKIQQGTFNLKANSFNMVIGEQLALTLGLSVGDKVTLFILSPTLTPAGIVPQMKRFTISGIFKTGNGFGFDDQLAFISIRDAQILFELGNGVSGLNLKLKNPYLAPEITENLISHYPPEFNISNWTEQYGPLFKAIKLEKTMMFFILMLIIAVAAFNLVTTLVMVVTDKQSDIAILRTLGATPKEIMLIFIVQGFVIGLFGTLLGLLGGIFLAANATELVSMIEHIFHTQLLSSNVYYVNYLPSKIMWSDLFTISISAFLLTMVATIYPAWRAANVQPAEALRYE